jgi:hypothetical protein
LINSCANHDIVGGGGELGDKEVNAKVEEDEEKGNKGR